MANKMKTSKIKARSEMLRGKRLPKSRRKFKNSRRASRQQIKPIIGSKEPGKKPPSGPVQSNTQGTSHQVSLDGITQYHERLWAAWQAGRLANELRFRMVQAWLTWTSDACSIVGDLFRELINVAHRIPTLRRSGGLLGNGIELECSDWRFNFGGEMHDEAHCIVVERFRVYSTDPGCTDEQVRWALGEYLQEVDRMRKSLGVQMRSQMDENQLRLYEFAAFIDRALHPTNDDVLQYVDVWSGVCGKNGAARKNKGSISETKVAWGGPPSPLPARWQLPSVARGPNYEVPATDNWLAEIEERWEELGFSDASLSAVLAPLSTSNVTNGDKVPPQAEHSVNTAPHADKIARQLDEAVRQELNVQRIPLQRVGSSRIRVDVKHLTAYLDEHLRLLDTRKEALFLDQLVHEHGNWISSSEMGTRIPELKGVRLDRLKMPDEIKALIEPRPGGGYRLRQAALTGIA